MSSRCRGPQVTHPQTQMTPSTTHPGRLPENVAHFVRLLRAAGLPVGPGHTITAVRALAAIDVTARRQFFWALHGTLVSRREHRHIFESAFRLFWRDPFGADAALSALLSRSQIPVETPPSRAPARYPRRTSPRPGAAPGPAAKPRNKSRCAWPFHPPKSSAPRISRTCPRPNFCRPGKRSGH